MRALRRITTLSDRTLDRALRAGVVLLVLGTLAFAATYYQDRHVAKGPSLLDRQVASAEKAVRGEPGSVSARLALAVAYQADERLDDAVKQYDEILKVNGNHRSALLGKGRALLAEGDLAGASAALQRVVGVAKPGEFAGADTQLEAAYYFLGDIALKQHQPKVALTRLQSALRIEPTDSDAWYLLGVAALQTGDAADAVKHVQRALAFVPTGWCEPYETLAKAYAALRQQQKAEYAGAMTDFCAKRLDRAAQRLTALVAGPEGVDAMLGLGLMAETAQQPDRAQAWYRKVLARDAKNAAALSAMARLGASPTSARQGAK